MHRPLSSRRYRRVPETGRLLVFLPLILPALAGGISRIAYAETNSVRLRQSMDSGWRFHLAAGRPLEQEQAVTGWRWKADSGARAVPTSLEAPASAPDTGDSAWQPVHYGDDVFHGRHGYTWFQATLPEVPGPHRVLHFDGVDDEGNGGGVGDAKVDEDDGAVAIGQGADLEDLALQLDVRSAVGVQNGEESAAD